MQTIANANSKPPSRLVGAACAVLCGTLLSWTSTADQRSASEPPLTRDEIRSILAHGPWPASTSRDPSNRVSGQPEAVEFGTHLFFDPRLSGKGNVSCGTCHVPERNWTDNMHRGVGNAEIDRNTPTLMNVRLGRWFGWDGAADSLWSQSIRPILQPRELGSSPRHVAELIRNDEQLACRYRRTFGAAPSTGNDEAILVDVAKALAAFQETLQSGQTSFDQFRDQLARGEPYSDWHYSPAAQRGLKLFIGKGGCNTCHTGANFTGDEFHNTGITSKMRDGQVDSGRSAGLQKLRDSRFTLVGPLQRRCCARRREAHRSGSERARRSGRIQGAVATQHHAHRALWPPWGSGEPRRHGATLFRGRPRARARQRDAETSAPEPERTRAAGPRRISRIAEHLQQSLAAGGQRALPMSRA